MNERHDFLDRRMPREIGAQLPETFRECRAAHEKLAVCGSNESDFLAREAATLETDDIEPDEIGLASILSRWRQIVRVIAATSQGVRSGC